jgi:hypothetical protein
MKQAFKVWYHGREIGDDGYGNVLMTPPGAGAKILKCVLTFCGKNWQPLLMATIAVFSGTANLIKK